MKAKLFRSSQQTRGFDQTYGGVMCALRRRLAAVGSSSVVDVVRQIARLDTSQLNKGFVRITRIFTDIVACQKAVFTTNSAHRAGLGRVERFRRSQLSRAYEARPIAQTQIVRTQRSK